MATVHPTTLLDPHAQIGENVTIGPYCWITDNVVIGDHCHIGGFVTLLPGTRLASNCTVLHHSVIGEVPQDLKFGGEPTTAEIGERTVIREFVTINRGTKAHWKTVIGSDCLLMAYSHVAHDCLLGNNIIMANAVNLAGHVEVEDFAILGGMVGIHQFVKIGRHCLIGGHFRVAKDVPPYIIAGNEPLRYSGLNIIGLRRRGFPTETIQALKHAYQLIYQSAYNVSEAVREIEKWDVIIPEVRHILEFIKKSERGILR